MAIADGVNGGLGLIHTQSAKGTVKGVARVKSAHPRPHPRSDHSRARPVTAGRDRDDRAKLRVLHVPRGRRLGKLAGLLSGNRRQGRFKNETRYDRH